MDFYLEEKERMILKEPLSQYIGEWLISSTDVRFVLFESEPARLGTSNTKFDVIFLTKENVAKRTCFFMKVDEKMDEKPYLSSSEEDRLIVKGFFELDPSVV
jgi:hypothetical protein